MKRVKPVKPDYISTRIEQIKEELTKPNSEHDKNWYNRLIQELDWARQMADQGYPSYNCYMEGEKNQTINNNVS